MKIAFGYSDVDETRTRVTSIWTERARIVPKDLVDGEVVVAAKGHSQDFTARSVEVFPENTLEWDGYGCDYQLKIVGDGLSLYKDGVILKRLDKERLGKLVTLLRAIDAYND